MNLEVVMDELGDALDTITGLRVHRHPPDSINPPTGIVAWPDDIDYDTSYGRGMDQITIPILVLVGRSTEPRVVKTRLAAYCAGSGANSVKTVIDGYAYTAADSVTVKSAHMEVVAIAGIDYLAALFDVDIVGPGT